MEVMNLPANQYDNATRPDGNANDQAARVAAEQQGTNAVQQQTQAAQRTAAPEPAIELPQERQDQQLRKQQSVGIGMSIW
jgi:hypothetical protein